MPEQMLWGVDSASRVGNDLYQCVVRNFGKPAYWGRYLATVPNAADGLTRAEASFLHRNGVKILPIYSKFTQAVGYGQGRIAARNSMYYAQLLGIPKGTMLFANIEKRFQVDEAWIRGWVDAVDQGGYRPGIYCDPSQPAFSRAYCLAQEKSEKVRTRTVLWSQEPTPGPSSPRQAPAYSPVRPPCPAQVWAWQYGENARECPVDTNLMNRRLFQWLW